MGSARDADEGLIVSGLSCLEEGLAFCDRDLALVAWNEAFVSLVGADPRAVARGRSIADLVDFEVLASREGHVYRLSNDAGGLVHVDQRPVGDGGWVFVCRDVTDRKTSESSYRKAEALALRTAELARMGHWEWDEREDRCAYCSPELARMHGFSVEAFLASASSTRAYRLWVHEEDRPAFDAALARLYGDEGEYDVMYRMLVTEGEQMWVREAGVAIRDEEGRVVRSVGFLQDVTDLKNTEQLLLASRADLEKKVADRTAELRRRATQFEYSHEVAQLGSWSWDSADDMLEVSPELAKIMGMDPPEAFRLPYEEWVRRFVHPNDHKLMLTLPDFEELPAGRLDLEFCLVRPDGSQRWARDIGEEVFDEAVGRWIEFGIIQDVTDKRETESLVRQAQKMEAVGQLTGGVAHDFNNLLLVVLGNLELAIEQVEERADPARCLQDALDAAWRGADLTKQLLTFAGRQAHAPEVRDVNEVIGQMTDMLRRVLGERIRVDTQLGAGPLHVSFDAAQLESAIVNLAINARDAMADGGVLHIRTAGESEQGVERAFVRISVGDEGHGMDPDVQERAVEPFFTTKDAGRGTGLGLSMVYGFAQRSGGKLVIESEPGRGTIVHLLLPRQEKQPLEPAKRALQVEHDAQGRVVLLVEDRGDVRQAVARSLRSLGYQVVEASSAKAALGVVRSATPIDLLLSDVVLPGGLEGPELARTVLEQRPDCAVLLMTGYAGALDEERELAYPLLRKPFERSDLARALDASLASAQGL